MQELFSRRVASQLPMQELFSRRIVSQLPMQELFSRQGGLSEQSPLIQRGRTPPPDPRLLRRPCESTPPVVMWGAPDRMQYPSGFLTFVVWRAPEGPQGVAAAYAGVIFSPGGAF